MSEQTNTQETQTAQSVEQSAPAENFDLTVQDLNALRQIIDVATQRGAFKAGEMVTVGTVYNKLNGFLETVTKQGQQQNG
jgi:hypothetical protein